VEMKEGRAKLLMFGAGGVGKTAVTERYILDDYTDEWDCPTVEDSYVKELSVDGEDHVLEILDTGGQEEFAALEDQWIRDADLFVVMYAISNLESYEIAEKKIEKIKLFKHDKYCPKGVLLVGNKKDEEEYRQVTTETAREKAQIEGISFAEVSAKTGEGVFEMFHDLVRVARDPSYWNKNVKRAVR